MYKSIIVFVLFGMQFSCTFGESLFLTPLIKKGQIRLAQKKAQVRPFKANVVSYSGYLTVDDRHNSNSFFWFFPKKTGWKKAPLVLWLQGGFGSSSLKGLFIANGPYICTKKSKLKLRKRSWNKFFNVVYIDNPVGTGFSFTNSSAGYATNQAMVGDHLYEALEQFLSLFPEIRKNKLILTGESYASKYITSLAYAIYMKNSSQPNIHVYGLLMGSSLTNMAKGLPYFGAYFEAHGLLDGAGRKLMTEREELILARIYSKHWEIAADLWLDMLRKCNGTNSTPSLFENITGICASRRPTNLLALDNQRETNYFVDFLLKNETTAALHAQDSRFQANSQSVFEKLKSDLMKPMELQFAIVLENFRTLVYSGQHDFLCPHYLQVRANEKFDWSGNWAYNQARRHAIRWKSDLRGYYKRAKGYTEVMLRNLGHLPAEQEPGLILALLQAFVSGDFDQSVGDINI